MARKSRVHFLTAPYHVIARKGQRQAIFLAKKIFPPPDTIDIEDDRSFRGGK